MTSGETSSGASIMEHSYAIAIRAYTPCKSGDAHCRGRNEHEHVAGVAAADMAGALRAIVGVASHSPARSKVTDTAS